jgi:DNA-binding winged helix-turn-helix (wHTH) protein
MGITGVVVITGASSGIGRCAAALFARQGWRVGLVARGEAGLQAASGDVEDQGAMAATARADVIDLDALEEAATCIERALGPMDVWVNCAGNATFGRFLDTPAAEFQRVTDVTYLGTVNGTRVGEARRVNHGKLATGRPDQPTGRPGEVVGKDELMARALPDTFVEAGNLKFQISGLRRTLGDGHDGNRYLATIPRRGYSFVAPLRLAEDLTLPPSQAIATARHHNLPCASSAASVSSAGNGQLSPALASRFNVSRTVEDATPTRRAISLPDTPAAFNRSTSRTWRIAILSAGIRPYHGKSQKSGR